MIRLLLVLLILAAICLIVYIKVQNDARKTQVKKRVAKDARWEINTVSTKAGMVIQLEMPNAEPQVVATVKMDDPAFQEKILEAQTEATEKMILLNAMRETQQQKQQG